MRRAILTTIGAVLGIIVGYCGSSYLFKPIGYCSGCHEKVYEWQSSEQKTWEEDWKDKYGFVGSFKLTGTFHEDCDPVDPGVKVEFK